MSFAFTHMFVPWLLGQLYQTTRKRKLSHWAWGALVFGGILPDADYLLQWGLGWHVHRTLTHSLLFVVLGGVGTFFLARWLTKEKAEQKAIGVALGIGVLTHLLLDMHGGPGIPLLWPSLLRFTYFQVAAPYVSPGLLNITSVEILHHLLQQAIVDMGIGAVWLFFLWRRERLRF